MDGANGGKNGGASGGGSDPQRTLDLTSVELAVEELEKLDLLDLEELRARKTLDRIAKDRSTAREMAGGHAHKIACDLGVPRGSTVSVDVDDGRALIIDVTRYAGEWPQLRICRKVSLEESTREGDPT